MEHFELRCECGQVHEVTIGMCGLEFPCHCGQSVRVPSSLKLREMAGLSAVAPDPELVIPEMVKAGELPLPSCIVCGLDADAVHYWIVECQRAHAVYERSAPPLLWVFFGPIIWVVMGPFILLRPERSFERASEVHGRDVAVRTPLRACEFCLTEVSASPVDWLLKPFQWIILATGIYLLLVHPIAGLGAIALSMILSFIRFRRSTRLNGTRRRYLMKIPQFQELFAKYPEAMITAET